jgi:hypothetical protein
MTKGIFVGQNWRFGCSYEAKEWGDLHALASLDINRKYRGWGYSSVVKHLHGKYKALGLILTPKNAGGEGQRCMLISLSYSFL